MTIDRAVSGSERNVRSDARKCYLCGEQRPIENTEVVRHRVPSATRGGTVQGVNRYVRMCKVGYGCKA